MSTSQTHSPQLSANIAERLVESGAVPRVSVHELNPQIFRHEFQLPGKPVVITQALETAIPVDIEKLVSLVGEIEVLTRIYGADRFSRPKTEWKSYCEMQSMTIANYCDHLLDGSAKRNHMYLALIEMGHTALRSVIGPCIDLIAKNTGLRQHPKIDINLWVGPGSHLEPLHYDGMDGTLSQFRGAKRVSLFSPRQTKNLYPFPISHGKMPPTFSQPYIDQPDFEQFPRLCEALKHRKVIILAEGETLYMPVGWWHEIEAIETDYICSINRFWQVDPIWRYVQAPRAACFQMIGALMRLRQSFK
jgi:lysine-specific demethylase 8/hypoxia-inducible factor 1-alpha inhibitor (HIF hydroxylase)